MFSVPALASLAVECAAGRGSAAAGMETISQPQNRRVPPWRAVRTVAFALPLRYAVPQSGPRGRAMVTIFEALGSLVTSTPADASSTAALVLLASAGARAAGVYVVRSGGGISEEAERTAIAAETLCRAQKLGLNEIDRRQRISSATPASPKCLGWSSETGENWVLTYPTHGKAPPTKWPRYDAAFRAEALRLASESRSARAAARALNIDA